MFSLNEYDDDDDNVSNDVFNVATQTYLH